MNLKKMIVGFVGLIVTLCAVRADIVLTQGFETTEGDGWSLSLGANSSSQHINDGTAAEGDFYVRFTLGENDVDGGGNIVDFASASVFGQRVWEDGLALRDIESTMQVRGEFSSYMVYQIVPDPSDLDNQIFVVGGSLLSPLSPTDWSTWSAGQSDPFHAAPFLGSLYELPPATSGSQVLLSDISQLPIRLAADSSDTGRVWGDAQVRWVSPQAGFSGGVGYSPASTTDLDQLIVNVIPEPSSVVLIGIGLLAFLIRTRLNRSVPSTENFNHSVHK